jgi:pimeloyl-ACP methyl ester carboxylesterase
MPTSRVNGFDLYYDEGGTGPPVVFVHGGFADLASVLLDLPTDASDWSWENDFAEHFRFVEYDRRGCYRSSRPEGGYGLLNQARDLEGLLDHLDVSSAHLIGSSAGGPIATVFAATRPDRTKSLTLAGTGMNLLGFDDPVNEIILRQIDVLRREGAEFAFEKRPPGVEVTLVVLWMPPEQQERGTIDVWRGILEDLGIDVPSEQVELAWEIA